MKWVSAEDYLARVEDQEVEPAPEESFDSYPDVWQELGDLDRRMKSSNLRWLGREWL